jgi:hypothetical protein
MVAVVRNADGWRVRYRRTFGPADAAEWNNLCRIFFYLHPFRYGNDKVSWVLEVSREYSTRSIYLRLSQGRWSPTSRKFGG